MKSETLTTTNSWELAGYVCKKLAREYNGFSFGRSELSHNLIEIFVEPSPEQMKYNEMQGYAKACKHFLLPICE